MEQTFALVEVGELRVSRFPRMPSCMFSAGKTSLTATTNANSCLVTRCFFAHMGQVGVSLLVNKHYMGPMVGSQGNCVSLL